MKRPTAGRRPTVCTEENKNRIIEAVQRDPNISIRKLTRKFNLTYYCVQKLFKKARYHVYHYLKVQELREIDRETLDAFCQWVIEQYENNDRFFENVLFTDK